MYDISLISADFKWASMSTWGEDDYRFFHDSQKRQNLNFFAHPPFFRKKDKPHLALGGQWVLQSLTDPPSLLATATSVNFKTHYSITYVTIDVDQRCEDKHVSFLVTAAAMIAKADVVRLVLIGNKEGLMTDLSSCVERKTIWSPVRNSSFGRSAGEVCPFGSLEMFEIDVEEWKQLSDIVKENKQLSYLAGALARNEKKECCCSKKRKKRPFRWGWSL
jgi:hypothetical protein